MGVRDGQIRSITDELDSRGIDLIYCAFIGNLGKHKARLIHRSAFQSVARHGLQIVGFAADILGQSAHSPDLTLKLDLETFCIVPLDKPVAWITGSLFSGDQLS